MHWQDSLFSSHCIVGLGVHGFEDMNKGYVLGFESTWLIKGLLLTSQPATTFNDNARQIWQPVS